MVAQVRLVCRLWNKLATEHLFRNLTLRHDLESLDTHFDYWLNLTDLAHVNKFARRVAIESALQDYDGSCYDGHWPPSWAKEGIWPVFEDSIDRIIDMPNLDVIEIRFASCCAGRNANRDPWAPELEIANPETAATRFHTLRAIVRAMEERSSRPNTSIIRELVLRNLQNMALPKDIADDLFHNIQRLHIKITTENYGTEYPDEERPDLIHREELREFPRYLQNTLLPSVAHQLVELTISGKHWGSIPGEFNGKGLTFLRLNTLTLDGFVILRKDQFDWILEQKSLTALHLHNCTIATYCLVQQTEFVN
ncbi:f-box protein [Fusarium sporotrichioides]|uniref:F-box protein n=1 Tax=Fusarium sporotrichioides TaxID=5514 RepID=A0A395SV20_FUSSP|nr:f-box protein [Fusarium sporotrichioides]